MKILFRFLLLLSVVSQAQSIDKNHSISVTPKIEVTPENLNSKWNNLSIEDGEKTVQGVHQNPVFESFRIIRVQPYTRLSGDGRLSIISRDGFNTDFQQNITYFDGFGKPIQEISVGSNTDGKDIVKHYETDEFGREVKNYLPVPINQNNGNFVNNVVSQVGTYYQTKFNDYTPFSQNNFDNTPLNRLTESASFGDDWKMLPNNSGHTTKLEYSFNTDQDKIRYYKFDSSNQLYYVSYPKNYLEKQIIKNENWKLSDGSLNTKEVYKDVKGNVVSEIEYVQSGNQIQKLITGYVYDDLGRLIYIVSPLASEKTAPVPERALNLTDFVPNGVQGSGSGNLEQTASNINITFSADFSSTYLKTGPLFYVHDQISDRDLGFVSSINGQINNNQDPDTPLPPPIDIDNYTAYIKDGYFCLKSSNSSNPTPYVTDIYFSYSIPFTRVMVTNPEILDELTTQYKYDEYNRKVAEKFPGKDWEYLVYDELDRPILVQDAILKKDNLWIFTKYDNFGREIYKGKYTDSRTRDEIQEHVKVVQDLGKRSENRVTTLNTIAGISVNYTNNVFPTSNIQEILSVTYYDNYDFTDSDKPTTPSIVESQQVTGKLKGLITGTWIKTLGANTWTKRYFYYDNKGRMIRTHQKNFLGGYTQTDSRLDFIGVVQNTVTKHKRILSDSEVVIQDKFKYDNNKRVTTHSQIINNQPEERIFKNIYSDFGQLQQKEVGGGITNNPLQVLNHKYNIRGWLTEINDVNNMGNSLFAYKINYHKNFEGYFNNPEVKYDGNIGQVIWKNKYNNDKKSYSFSYDQLNRLKSAEYAYGETLNDFSASSYSEHISNYDANGNILNSSRMGISPYNGYTTEIDGLNYRYNQGNKLLEVADSGLKEKGFIDNYTTGTDDYEYNENGNLIKDTNKGIASITYNHLDLVQQVTFNDGKTIVFVYDASGNKLSKTFTSAGVSTTTEYLGAFQYQQQQLQFFATSEGYAYFNPTQNNFKYAYQYTDHLGNIRLSYSDADGNGAVTNAEILSATDYYPMGMIIYDYNSSVASNYNYKLQGKEYQQEGNIDLYDFGSRMYDPAVGRWFCPDPQNQYYSPYLAMGNNYVNAVDPDGEWAHLVVGAAIGGFVNWAANGAQFNAKGLASFGVGALAGAVSAGVGAGVSSAMAFGGTFGAGFIGSSAAMTATTSFVSGAAIGGASGFSAGFITSFGNGLMAGQNFGQAFWSGTKDGIIGGAIGGITGGVLGGIDAVKNNRDFWGGKPWETVTEYSLPNNGNLPPRKQVDEAVGCTQETLESIAEYKGRPINGLDKSKGEDFANLAKQHGFETKTVLPRTPNSEGMVGSQLNIGNPSAITYNNGGTYHTVGVNKIQIQQVPRVLGSGFRTRTLVQVMDPLHSTYQNLPYSTFKRSLIRVVMP